MAVEVGTARVVGMDPEAIVAEMARLLEDRRAHEEMPFAANPYGDGRASQRIVLAPWLFEEEVADSVSE